jgi:ligand-binding sensor domain-containing protein
VDVHISFLSIPLTLKVMVLRVLLGCIFYGLLPASSSAQQPGSWQDHLPYHQAKAVSSSPDKIICATPYALFTVSLKDNAIERRSKINGLSEVGIAAMKADGQSGKTVVAYSDGNVDISTSSSTINLDQLKKSNISPVKNVHSIFLDNNKAWLAASFGIVLVDLLKNEIRETYIIGNEGKKVPVYQVATDQSHVYAATEDGLLSAETANVNLSDFRNWHATAGLAGGSVQQVVAVSNKIVARKHDSLFVRENNNWRFLYTSAGRTKWINSSDGKLLIAEVNASGAPRIIIMEGDGSISNIYQGDVMRSPMDATVKGNEIWIADSVSGLLQSSGNTFKRYQPNSPYRISSGQMVYADNSLWVAAGELNSEYRNSFSKSGFFQYNNMTWKNFTPDAIPALDSLYDLVSVAISSKDRSVWVGSLGGGMLRFKEQEPLQIFKQQSGISPSAFHPGQYRVTGLAFDAEDNLWISNYGATENLVARKSDGSWRKFTPPYSLSNNAVAHLLLDDFNQKWIISPGGDGLLVFNHGLSIDNTGDDRWKLFEAGKGNGNLPDNNVLSIAKDKSGFLWVGTERGIGIIQCAGAVFSGSCEALLPVVQQDNFAGYLFSQETVQDIAVNGADQKWIATKNGVWLITPDGEKTIHHFTSDNSPLFSNDVRKIAIDPRSGDVFFATAKGICSFRGSAIEGTSVNELVKVYPNPVPPGYNGAIAIRGLVNNAIVKITELDGRLVFQTRALGGQAIWDGRDYRGRQASSGVYLVLISDDSRQEKTVGKIVFISR